jgi:hypothetical protein
VRILVRTWSLDDTRIREDEQKNRQQSRFSRQQPAWWLTRNVLLFFQEL